MSEGKQDVVVERVWDLPTRALKWALAGSFALSWIYGWTMSFTTIQTHIWLGYGLAGILTLRLLWGLVGAPASRFSALFNAVAEAPGYVMGLFKPEPSNYPGHNPMGSLWILVFWTLLLVQIGTGLMSYSDSYFDGGPLASMVGERWSAWANSVHALVARVLLAMVILHLTAVFYYAVWKMEDLIGPMLTGEKKVRRREP